MGTIKTKTERKEVKVNGKTGVYDFYQEDELKKFNTAVLGLGNVGVKSRQIGVLAAVFDLAGFTNFCSQVDPHLSMPRFLKEFLDWLFESIKSEFEFKRFSEGVVLYANLPIFAKFMGDGVLFLWDVENMQMNLICNVVVSLSNICGQYSSAFAPKIKKHLSDVPKSLRCGVARGQVCSVGNGEDYVGPCINIASRLQKLSNLGFCFSKRGIDFEEGMLKAAAETYIVKRVSIRGVGRDELVVVEKGVFEKLSKRDKTLFKDV